MRAQWIKVSGGSAEGDLSCTVGHRVPGTNGAAEGIYAGWQWNGRTLTIEQDRYGFFPLFEWRTAEAHWVSTDLGTLIERGAPTELDLDALAVFFRIGFFLGRDTPFRAIRAVLPPDLPRSHLAITRHAAIDGFIDLFKAAIARRLPSGPYVLPLSGGRDSRHILFALHEVGYPPAACVTVRHFPPRSNDDERVAAELCAMLGIPHHLVPQPPDRKLLERRKNAATHSCSDEHTQFVVLADHLRAHTRETHDGIAGDVLSQSGYLTPQSHAFFERGDTRGFASFVLAGYGTALSEIALARTLAPRIYAAVPRERALARLSREIARHADGPNPTAAFFLANRTRREIALAPYGLMRDIIVYAPYLDAALYDFLAGLPASVQMDRTLHTEAIARAWPGFAHVAYERKGAAVGDPRATRRLARTLAPIAARGGRRGWIRAAAVLPRLAATAIDGRPERLWDAALLFYVDHIAEVASAGAAASRAR